MFNKGDRVRVVKLVTDEALPYYYIGAVGTVLKHFQHFQNSDVLVMFDKDAKGNKDLWYVLPEELEKINA